MAWREKAPSSNSSSSRSNVSHHHQGLTESELTAAKQLMQLSDDKNSSTSSCGINNKKNKRKRIENQYETDEEEGVVDEYQSPLSVITCAAKIENIFGKEEEDEDEYVRPVKKQKYRSLPDIYRTTNKPIGPIKMNASTSHRHHH